MHHLLIILPIIYVMFIAAYAQDLIASTCMHTLYYDTCTAVLRSDPHGPTSDLRGLAAISISISTASSYASDTAALMRKLKYDARRTNQTETWQALRACLAGYDEGTSDLEQARRALSDGEYDTVNFMLAGMMANVDTCQGAIMETGGASAGTSALTSVTERNEYLVRLCSNAMAITKLLG